MSNPKYTALPVAFDATQVEPQQPMEAIPPGWYPVVISDGETKANAGGAGVRMELEWTVLDGPFKGRKVFDGFNIQHPNAQTQEIAQRQFSAICHATQVLRVQDVSQLFQKPHQIQVDQEPGRWVGADNQTIDVQPGTQPPQGAKFYNAKNRFRGAKPAGEGAAAPSGTGAAPQWAAAPKPATAPAAAPAASLPAGATPPWLAKPGAAPTPATPAPAAAPAAAPVAPAAAPKGPKGPKGPKAAPKQEERKFHVFLPDGTVSDPKPESEVVKMLQSGMPMETMLAPEGGGDDSWKAAGEWGLGAAPAAATPPPAATPAGAPVAPPWLR